MSANLRTFVKALYGFDAAVVRTPGDAWSQQSPCEDWTAADVVGHNVAMNRMIADFTHGIDARRPAHEVPADPVAAWQASLDGLLLALDTQGALQTEATTPWGEMPVDRFLGFAWIDPLTHTWDLARATGQDPVLDEALCARAVTQLERAGDSLRGSGAFGAAVEVGTDASIGDRFIALTGRDPSV